MPSQQDYQAAQLDLQRLEIQMREMHQHDPHLMQTTLNHMRANSSELLERIAFARRSANSTWHQAQSLLR